MTWYILILLYAAPFEPEMMGAFKTEQACHAWFKAAEATGDVPDVVRYECVRVTP